MDGPAGVQREMGNVTRRLLKRTKEGLLKMGGFSPLEVWRFRTWKTPTLAGYELLVLGRVFHSITFSGETSLCEKNIGGVVRVLKVHR